MRMLVLSDLHLEFARFSPVWNDQRIDDGVDVVLLAGDIAEGTQGIRWARETFVTKEIVYVLGNHEFYSGHIQFLTKHARDVANRMGVHLLEHDAIGLGGVRFLGTTLWTDFNFFGAQHRQGAVGAAEMYLNDYQCIKTFVASPGDAMNRQARLLRAEDTAGMHKESSAWLAGELSRGDPAKTVVVTHHAPHRLSVHPRYERDMVSAAYVSDLSHLMGQAAIWVHGHMHDSADYRVNGTRVVCNPRGYGRRDGSNENERFKPGLLIEI
ncbi:metallophosphoesterase [Hydrogenophaga sp.]|uniref:metallophosphoesterase n=1 Tax=Hydrogenophaga sp. TaxID=1904254 RepID=UPI0025C68DF9|nr:metallophosphoesterase [Hydrogenophaga sp.]